MNMVLYPRRLEWNLCLVFTKSVILHILLYFFSAEEELEFEASCLRDVLWLRNTHNFMKCVQLHGEEQCFI